MEILGNENSITAVSKREKVAYQTLRKWIEQFKETGLSAEEDDIIRLKKENLAPY